MRQPTDLQRAVSIQQMQRIDELAIHTVGIPRLLLMDHAGRAVANAVRSLIPEPSHEVLVCCGTGHNGGDGFCAARYLLQWGYPLRVVLAGTTVPHLKEEPAVYATILSHLHVALLEVTDDAQLTQAAPVFAHPSVIVDALLGIGWQGPVRPLTARLIALINQANKPVVAADVPSGLDADTGRPHDVAVHATVTVTFGLPKQGLFLGEGPAHVGEVIVDDLGIPTTVLSAT